MKYLFMETIKLSEFNWNEISELNSGHTSSEWGLSARKSIPKTLVSYKMPWEIQDCFSIILFSGVELI